MNKKVLKKKSLVEKTDETLLQNKPLFVKKKLKRKIKVRYEHFGLFPFNFYKYSGIAQDIKTYLDFLVSNNIPPVNNEDVLDIFEYWNKLVVKNTNVRKTGLNIEAKKFKELRILLTYKMHDKQLSVEDLKKSIGLFHKFCKNQKQLMYMKNIEIGCPFLWQSPKYYRKNWLEICLLPEPMAIQEAYGSRAKYKKTFDDRVVKSYTDHFHNGTKKFAHKSILENYLTFINFSDRMVVDHQNRKMYGHTIDEYIDEYFIFAKEDTKWMELPPSTTYILSEKMKDRFWQYMRMQGYEEFGKMKNKKDEKTS